MKISVYQIDAFTDKMFKGSPAAVCFADGDLSDEVMLNIAAEMNFSETAFIQPLKDEDSSGTSVYSIRWFAPKMEMPLCGHATLAASKVIFDCLGLKGDRILFRSISGELESCRYGNRFILDFPADEPIKPEPISDLLEALGILKYKELIYGNITNKYIIRLHTEKEVRNLRPNFERMLTVKASYPIKGIGITAEGEGDYDIVSRYFNPWSGVNEDPVTGSVHTVLAPYWSEVLGRKELRALQASERCGEIFIRIAGNGRLKFIGDAVLVMHGEMYL